MTWKITLVATGAITVPAHSRSWAFGLLIDACRWQSPETV